MGIIASYRELRQMPTEDLIEQYDGQAGRTDLGVSFIRQELAIRESEAQTREIARMTRTMKQLTWAIAAMTLVNLVLVAWSLAN